MFQYPCPDCGNVFYSNSALVNHQCNKNKTIETVTKTVNHPNKCPKCDKKIYSYFAEKSNIIQSLCYACGYYWSNSSIYKPCKELETMVIRNPFLLKMIIKQQRI